MIPPGRPLSCVLGQLMPLYRRSEMTTLSMTRAKANMLAPAMIQPTPLMSMIISAPHPNSRISLRNC